MSVVTASGKILDPVILSGPMVSKTLDMSYLVSSVVFKKSVYGMGTNIKYLQRKEG